MAARGAIENRLQLGRDGQPLERTDVRAARVPRWYESEDRFRCRADDAKKLAAGFAGIALAQPPDQHLPVHTNVFARRRLAKHVRGFEVREGLADIAGLLRAGSVELWRKGRPRKAWRQGRPSRVGAASAQNAGTSVQPDPPMQSVRFSSALAAA